MFDSTTSSQVSTNKQGTTKICISCGHAKTLAEFGNHSNNTDGKQPYCKKCRKTQYRFYKTLKQLPNTINTNKMHSLIVDKQYKQITNTPFLEAYSILDTDTLKTQLLTNLKYYVNTKYAELHKKYLVNATLYVLALAHNTSPKIARKALRSIVKNPQVFDTSTKQNQVAQITPHLRAALRNLNTTPKNRVIKLKKNATPAKQTTQPIATPVVIKKTKRAYKKANPTPQIKSPAPQNNTPWQTGNIVLIKEANTIVPVTIQKLSNNNKCFLSENKWYEIDQVEYIDFVTP